MLQTSLEENKKLLEFCLSLSEPEFETYIQKVLGADISVAHKLSECSVLNLSDKLDYFTPRIKLATSRAIDIVLAEVLGVSEASAEKLIFIYQCKSTLKNNLNVSDNKSKLDKLNRLLDVSSISEAYKFARSLR
jgi:hypothetical protein